MFKFLRDIIHRISDYRPILNESSSDEDIKEKGWSTNVLEDYEEVHECSIINLEERREKIFQEMNKKIKNPTSDQLYQLAGDEKCFHPPLHLVDLTEETGDIVCSLCGVVVMDLQPSTSYNLQPGQVRDDNFRETYSKREENAICESKSEILTTIEDILSYLDIEGEGMKYNLYQTLYHYSKVLGIKFRSFVTQKKYASYMAYVFFGFLADQNIYRNPAKIAAIFQTNFQAMLMVENLIGKHRINNFSFRPVIFYRPSQMVMAICSTFGLSFPVTMTVYDVIREVEITNYGVSANKMIYKVIYDVLHLLKPELEGDKSKLRHMSVLADICNLSHRQASKAEVNAFVSQLVLVRIMMKRKVI